MINVRSGWNTFRVETKFLATLVLSNSFVANRVNSKQLKDKKRSKLPDGYWDNENNVKNFLTQLKIKLNLNEPKDWDLITRKIIHSNGGGSLLKNYSIHELKYLGCPELEFTNKKEIKKPPRYWDNEENIVKFLNNLQEKYNLKNANDWNLISNKEIISNGGASLLRKYSIFELKCLAYPNGKLEFNKQIKSPGFWDKKENVIQFLFELKEKLNLNSFEDWNSLKYNQVKSFGGSRLLSKYSLFDLKCLGFPSGKFQFNISNKPFGFWDNNENVIQFLNDFKLKYYLNSPKDWSLITKNQILSFGGQGLFKKYSMFDLICLGCPDGKEYFISIQKPHGYWNNKDNILNFLNQVKIKYNLKTNEDWNRLSLKQINNEGGYSLTDKYSLTQIIRFINPDFKENQRQESISSKRSSQRWLFLLIQKLFPGEEIIEDYFHSDISRISGFSVQFDVYLINRKIAVEYFGKHHYEDIPATFSSVELNKYRDKEKAKLCKQFGITLIVVPYWWNDNENSLKDMLHAHFDNKKFI